MSTLPTTHHKAKLLTPGELAIENALKILQTATIIHRLFWQSGPVPQPIRMDRKGSSDSPASSADPSPSTPDTSSPLRFGTRAVTDVNFTGHETQ